MSESSFVYRANGSNVYKALANTSYNGDPVLYNLFSAYPSVSNYITFLLRRSGLGITEGGIFTIGDVDATLSPVLNQTQIPVFPGSPYWITSMEGIVVNGQNFTEFNGS